MTLSRESARSVERMQRRATQPGGAHHVRLARALPPPPPRPRPACWPLAKRGSPGRTPVALTTASVLRFTFCCHFSGPSSLLLYGALPCFAQWCVSSPCGVLLRNAQPSSKQATGFSGWSSRGGPCRAPPAARSPPRAAADAAASAVGRKGGKGGGKGGPPAGKGKGSDYDDYDRPSGKGGAYGDRAAGGARQGPSRDDPAERPVACCEDGCPFRSRTPQGLISHHSAKHGRAPFSSTEMGPEEWRRKVQRSTDVVVKATGVRPGEPRFAHGNHAGRGRGGGGGRARASRAW